MIFKKFTNSNVRERCFFFHPFRILYTLTPTCLISNLRKVLRHKPFPPLCIKHLVKCPCVLRRHITFMNIPCREEEGHFVYSLRVGRVLCIFGKLRSFSLLPTMCKNPPHPTLYHLHMLRFMITSPHALQWINPWIGDISKMRGWIQLQSNPGHFILGMLVLGIYSTRKNLIIIS
jgi:hypothetical protein